MRLVQAVVDWIRLWLGLDRAVTRTSYALGHAGLGSATDEALLRHYSGLLQMRLY